MKKSAQDVEEKVDQEGQEDNLLAEEGLSKNARKRLKKKL